MAYLDHVECLPRIYQHKASWCLKFGDLAVLTLPKG